MRALVLAGSVILAGCANGDFEYVRCGADPDCTGRARCHTIDWRDGSGGLCTVECTGEADCPHEGRCIDVELDDRYRCYATCESDDECAPGTICQPITTAGAICLPSG